MSGNPTGEQAPPPQAPPPPPTQVQPLGMQWQGMPMLLQGSGGQESAFFMQQQMQMQQQMALQMQMLQMMQQQMAMAGVQPMMQVPSPTVIPNTSTLSQMQTVPQQPPTTASLAEVSQTTTIPTNELNSVVLGDKPGASKETPTPALPRPGRFCGHCKLHGHSEVTCWMRKTQKKDLAAPNTTEKITAPKRARSPSPTNNRKSDRKERTRSRTRSRSRSKAHVRRSQSRDDRRSWSVDSYEQDNDRKVDGYFRGKTKKSHYPSFFEGRVVELGLLHPAAAVATVPLQFRARYVRQLFDYMTHETFLLWRPTEDYGEIFTKGLSTRQRDTIYGRLFPPNEPSEDDEAWHNAADRWMTRSVALLLTIISRHGRDDHSNPVYKACLNVVNHNLQALEPKEHETLEGFWDRIYTTSAAMLKISLTPPDGKKSYVSAVKTPGPVFVPLFHRQL